MFSLSGHYCPSSSTSPIPCPPGTNSTKTGLKRQSQCSQCPQGYYCPSSGTIIAVNSCIQGFYCPTGTVIPSKVCPIGSYCPEGSSIPSICASGKYQDEVQQENCKVIIFLNIFNYYNYFNLS
jgi:hypothetical protein